MADFFQQGQKLPAQQKLNVFQRRTLEQTENNAPIRILAPQQLTDRFALRVVETKAPMRLLRVLIGQSIQIHIPQFHHIGRHLVCVLPALLHLRPDSPDHEFMLRHGADQAVQPGGHPAGNKRVAAFTDHANSHCSFSHVIRTCASVARSQ